MVILVALWLAVGCALPLHRVHEARREGREKLLGVLSADRPDKADAIRVFETANQDFDAAASGPCLLLSVSIIYLAWQLLKLKRRYNEIDPRSRNAVSLDTGTPD